jgi:hypothetical protein
MKKMTLYFILLSWSMACKKKEQEVNPTIDNEALTTVSVRLSNTQAPFDKDTATWEQLLDRNGHPLPVDTSKALLSLRPHSVYHAELVLLDKTQSPYGDASIEIRERSNYHLFFYQPLPSALPLVIPTSPKDVLPLPIPSGNSVLSQDSASALQLSILITDQDSNTPPLPVGLQANFTTGAASRGWLRILLRHQPNGKNGTFAPGSTDLDVGYSVKIQ